MNRYRHAFLVVVLSVCGCGGPEVAPGFGPGGTAAGGMAAGSDGQLVLTAPRFGTTDPRASAQRLGLGESWQIGTVGAPIVRLRIHPNGTFVPALRLQYLTAAGRNDLVLSGNEAGGCREGYIKRICGLRPMGDGSFEATLMLSRRHAGQTLNVDVLDASALDPQGNSIGSGAAGAHYTLEVLPLPVEQVTMTFRSWLDGRGPDPASLPARLSYDVSAELRAELPQLHYVAYVDITLASPTGAFTFATGPNAQPDEQTQQPSTTKRLDAFAVALWLDWKFASDETLGYYDHANIDAVDVLGVSTTTLSTALQAIDLRQSAQLFTVY